MSLLRSGHCYVIGEVAQAHEGSLGSAHAFIDAIANAGADAVKFQTHIAEAESTTAEPWRTKFSQQDITRFDYWKRMSFSEAHWAELKQHADARGIGFISSPFSFEATDLLRRLGVTAWKVASGEVNNLPMIERMATHGSPMLISSGMSTFAELDGAVATVRKHKREFAVLQCTTEYPTPPERVGLNILGTLAERFDCPVGLSDHSGTIYPSLAAATLGAAVVEVHVTLSREAFGPDVVASVTTAELRTLTDGVRFIERMLANAADKDEAAARTAPLRAIFTKSVVARADLQAGTVLSAEHLALKKPGTGLPPARLAGLVGRRLQNGVSTDQMISDEDLFPE